MEKRDLKNASSQLWGWIYSLFKQLARWRASQVANASWRWQMAEPSAPSFSPLHEPRTPACSSLHRKVLVQVGAYPYLRADLLARILGAPLSEVRKVTDDCIELGLLAAQRILVRELEPWLWLTSRGESFIHSSHRAAGPPSLGRLPRLEALAHAQIFLSERGYTQGHWFLRGVHVSMWGRLSNAADALFIHGSRSTAVVVLMVPKPQERVVSQLARLSGLDEVYCFCAPMARKRVERALVDGNLRNVHVLDTHEVAEAIGVEPLTGIGRATAGARKGPLEKTQHLRMVRRSGWQVQACGLLRKLLQARGCELSR